MDLFFNKAAFSVPVGALGNAPRTNPDVRRDWSLNENISIAKTFTASRINFDVRIEAFNLFNRVEWGAPNSNFSNAAFGQVTSTRRTPRGRCRSASRCTFRQDRAGSCASASGPPSVTSCF